MKKYLLLFAVLFLFFNIKAAHVLGGDIAYKYVSANNYEVTLTVYRDCNSTGSIDSSITATCNSGTATFSLTQVSVTDITGLQSSCGIKSACESGAFPYGIQEYVYSATINLSGLSCCEVTLSWIQCCRVNLSTVSTATPNLYFETKLNKCVQSSSPVFTSTPRFLLPIGHDAFFSYFGVDGDGDSLSYELVPALLAAGTPVQYSGNYSAQKPLSFLGFPNANLSSPAGFHFDNTQGTGNMSFRPTISGQVFPIAVKIKEWRKISGTMTEIGSVTRDYMFFTHTKLTNYSQSRAPFFTKPEAQTLSVCDSLGTRCFDIPIEDTDITDSVKYTLVHNLKNLTHTRIGSATDFIIRVCFTVDSAELNTTEYKYLTVIAEDELCPVPQKTTKTFAVRMHYREMPGIVNISKFLGNCKAVAFNTTGLYGFSTINNWNITTPSSSYTTSSASAWYTAQAAGWHKAHLMVSSPDYCNTQTDEDSVYVPPSFNIAVNTGKDTLLCHSNTALLTAKVSNGVAPLTYLWNDGRTTDTINIAPALGSYVYKVAVTDSFGCKAEDSVAVKISAPVVTVGGDTAQCPGKPFTLMAAVTGVVNPTYGWAGFIGGQDTVTTQRQFTNTYTFMVNDMGCTASGTWKVTIYNPAVSFTPNIFACLGDSVKLKAIKQGGLPPLTVNWATFGQSGDSIVVPSQPTAGSFTHTAIVTDAFGCTGTRQGQIIYRDLPVINTTPLPDVCENSDSINLYTYAVPQGGTWNGTNITGTYFHPSQAGSGTHNLLYTYTSLATGCTNTAQSTISIDAAPTAGFSVSDTTGPVPLTVNFSNSSAGATSYFWIISDSTGTPVALRSQTAFSFDFTSTGKYSIKMVAYNGTCTDTVEQTDYIRVTDSVSGTKSIRRAAGLIRSLYPNPAQNTLHIETGFEIATITVSDVLGRQSVTEVTITNSRATVNCSSLAAGTYFITAVAKDGRRAMSSFVVAR